MAQNKHWEQDKEATVYIGNLDERVTDAIVWELMLQAGRIVNVHLPKDRVTQTHQGFGFVEFISEEDAEYAARIMNQIRLYGKPIRVNKASADKQKTVEVGAELFVGNLDPMVDEKTLFETFSTFGNLVAAPKIARDESGASKGYGFVSYDSFEASDKAIESMNGQYLMNKEVSVQYAYKKDGKGERHGDQAERLLAAQARKNNVQIATQQLPPQLFAPTAPAAAVASVPAVAPQIPVAPAAMAGSHHPRGPPAMPTQHSSMPYHPPPPPPAPAPAAAPHIPRPPPTGPAAHSAPPTGPSSTLPPAGLPPRPPPPVGFQQPHSFHPPQPSSYGAGFGQTSTQPSGFHPPPPQGFGGAPPPPLPAGFGNAMSRPAPAPPHGAPPGFSAPPSGFGMAPPPGAPPGFPNPMGVPPQGPPGGYPGYGRGRYGSS
ncbi:hypothetical protein BDZ91DRAFT_677306 [Kalaharituber pfeilii]|nr:hypothetical protein BDZ91DRAFT_677306 [Kalaharituber pfeilii]